MNYIFQKNFYKTTSRIAVSSVIGVMLSVIVINPALALTIDTDVSTNGDQFGHLAATPGDAEYGSVIINTGGIVTGNVYGGNSTTDDAEYNTVIMNDGTVTGNIFGGQGNGVSGDAENNTVIINGGTVNVTAPTTNGNVYGGFSTSGDAEDNTVIITGGTIGGDVYGGHGALDADDNTVNVYSGTTGNGGIVTGTVYGGKTTAGTPSLLFADDFTDNTLNVYGKFTAKATANFQYYNFHITDTTASGDTLLTVTDAVDLTSPHFGFFPTAAIRTVSHGATLGIGESITLINKTNVPTSGITAQNAMQGINYIWVFNVAYGTDGKMDATLTEKKANSKRKELASGVIVSNLAVLNGGNFVNTQGINAILKAESRLIAQKNTLIAEVEETTATDAMPSSEAENHIIPFATASYGQSKFDNSLKTKIEGMNFMGGVGFSFTGDSGRLLIAPFAEVGLGNYDIEPYHTYKDEDYNFFGGGLVLRFDHKSRVYGEISVRAGQTSAEYSTSDFASPISYNTDNTYVSASLSGGYVMAVTPKTDLDVYARYSFTYTEGDSFIMLGDAFNVDASNTNAALVGAKVNHEFHKNVIPYAGVEVEYSFHGDTSDTDDNSEQGVTGYLTIGSNFSFGNLDWLFLDVAVDGFAGYRTGFMGTATVKFLF